MPTRSSSARSDSPMFRREFLRRGALAGAALSATGSAVSPLDSANPNESFVVGVVGLSRGLGLISSASKLPGVRLAHVCDVDSQRVARAQERVQKMGRPKPKGVGDFRRILDDKSVDAIFIATCNHWHAPATILACKAGKHVYVEKPGSNTAHEGELMVAAGKKYDRVIQMGNQRRSWPSIKEAIQKLRQGAIGTLRYARCWYNNTRPSIGHVEPSKPPAHLDYALWQGPAPERPYRSNVVHYNWHWHWHWGNGELGNNGIHALDIARWGLDVDAPRSVAYVGGRYHHRDDQETPDTGSVLFDFGDVGASWEGSSCHPRKGEALPFVCFYGDGGRLAITDPGYTIHDNEGKVVEENAGHRDDPGHIQNFLDCTRSGDKPNSHIEDGQRSTLLCHLGNIAYRAGETVHVDQKTRRIVGSKRARALWTREYRTGWEPSV